MIRIHWDSSALPYGAVMEIYQDELRCRAQKAYTDVSPTEALFEAEQDFYSYLSQDFFSVKGAFLVILGDASALRMEPYMDGYLLTGLCTAPAHRRKGLANMLLRHAISVLPENCPIYSHVEKSNEASVAFHKAFGFMTISDHAQLIDGTHASDYWTLRYLSGS